MPIKDGLPFLSLSSLNRVLAAAVLLAASVMVFNLSSSAFRLFRTPSFNASAAPFSADLPAATSRVRPLETYLRKAGIRDLFKEGPALKDVAAPTGAEAVKSLTLVGVAWSAHPDALIEDRQNRKTYFAKSGQILENGVKVEAVFRDRVILSYQGREFTLR